MFHDSLVPDQTPELIDGFIKDYINEEFAKLNSRNTMTVELTDSGAPWVTDPDHPNYHAAAVATEVCATPNIFWHSISLKVWTGNLWRPT